MMCFYSEIKRVGSFRSLYQKENLKENIKKQTG